ncbi:unnamed protein product [marine sediment metagenome]|uniref:Polynucleotide kinase n=1 Tax=marine sediment metagenome TaxID=412755 RepID=X0UT01_9ZZZZ
MSVPTIAVDFDGTLVKHRYPKIGDEVPGAIEWCKRWQAAGAQLILLTMRDYNTPSPTSKLPGANVLADALQWCLERGVWFWGTNENPEQSSWSKSPKVYAHVYVDDANACAPLIYEPERPFLDWTVIGPGVLWTIKCMSETR